MPPDYILKAIRHQIRLWLGFRSRSHSGSSQRSPNIIFEIWGPTSKGRRRRKGGRTKGKKRNRRRKKGRGWGRKKHGRYREKRKARPQFTFYDYVTEGRLDSNTGRGKVATKRSLGRKRLNAFNWMEITAANDFALKTTFLKLKWRSMTVIWSHHSSTLVWGKIIGVPYPELRGTCTLMPPILIKLMTMLKSTWRQSWKIINYHKLGSIIITANSPYFERKREATV